MRSFPYIVNLHFIFISITKTLPNKEGNLVYIAIEKNVTPKNRFFFHFD